MSEVVIQRLSISLLLLLSAAYVVAFSRLALDWLAVFELSLLVLPPAMFNAVLTCLTRSRGGQTVGLLATVGYALWVAAVYVNAVLINPDAQSPIAFLFVGPAAAPVLVVLCVIALVFEWKGRPAR